MAAGKTGQAVDEGLAEYISFDEFRQGLPRGRFHVVVNPDLARRFMAHRARATPVALALIGPGVALALVGWPWVGGALVAAGVLFRRGLAWQAPQLLLWLASRHEDAYTSATRHGVMEVQRR